MEAIVDCDDLDIVFRTGEEELKSMASRFELCSSHGVIKGCVGCLDGYLCRIKAPGKQAPGNSKSYWSGHYHANGVNVQAACDSESRFTFFALAAPGGSNDIHAYNKTALKDIVNNLPTGYYIIGDNAYVPTEHLITPFAGSQREDAVKDAYNFYCSQLHIKIEIAFGLITTIYQFSQCQHDTIFNCQAAQLRHFGAPTSYTGKH